MRAFLAIIKLTFHNAFRSHIFQLLLGVLAICAVGIPVTVSGDGTAAGFIQVSLLYSLSAISVVLALSALWISCFTMTQDIDGYQIHMVVTKPVSRIVIFLAKYCAVIFIHVILLIISGIVIYFIIISQFSRQDFSKAERVRVDNEVLVGRRVFKFAPPDFEKRSQEMLKERLAKIAETGESLELSTRNEKNILQEMRRMVIAENAQVKPGSVQEWVFENLPKDSKQPLFLRYRTYVEKVSSKKQRMTSGVWYIGVPIFEKDADGKIIDKNKYQISYYQYPQENIRSGEFFEKIIPADKMDIITPDGKVFVAYRNLDPEKQTQFFQPSDGPQVLMKVTGFINNYARAILVIFLEIIILAGLGCAFSSVLSMPTAIFLSITYLFFGAFATFLSESATSGEWFLEILSKILLVLVIPLQNFNVTSLIFKGELIELSMIGGLFLFYFVLKAFPIIVVTMFLYRRREIGLVIRK